MFYQICKKKIVSKVISIVNAQIYQQEKLILANVSLELFETEFAYLIGRTGIGKTSLLKLLYGELSMVNGEATVVGFNLKSLTKKEIPFLRRKIGIVFQDFQLLMDRTVIQNLYFCIKRNRMERKSNDS